MKATTTIIASSLLLFSSSAAAFSTTLQSDTLSRRQILVDGISTALISSTLISQTLPAWADDGFQTTDSGIKYKVTSPPTDVNSPKPVRAQKVKAKYTLYLNGFPEDNSNSKKIDSSKGPFGDKPFEFTAGVSQVIKGWDLMVLEMRVGEARQLIIPSKLGYGDKGAGSSIPGGSTLYFNMELVELGAKPSLNAEQTKWLEDNPL